MNTKQSDRLSGRFRTSGLWLSLIAFEVLISLIVRSNTMEPSIFRVFLIAFRNIALTLAPDLFTALGTWYAEYPYAPLLVKLLCITPVLGLGVSLVHALRRAPRRFRQPSFAKLTAALDQLRQRFRRDARPQADEPYVRHAPPPVMEPPAAPTAAQRQFREFFTPQNRVSQEPPVQRRSEPSEAQSPIARWLRENQEQAQQQHQALVNTVSRNLFSIDEPVVRLQDFSLGKPRDEILKWDDQRCCTILLDRLVLTLDYTPDEQTHTMTPRILGAAMDAQEYVEDFFPLEIDTPLVIMRQDGDKPHVRCALTWIGGY